MELPGVIQRQLEDVRARVRVGFPRLLQPFLRGFLAITLGSKIYLAPRLVERGEQAVAATLRHELVHVAQIRRLGFFRFYWRYLVEYLKLRFAGLGHIDAYDNISFEKEARQKSRGAP